MTDVFISYSRKERPFVRRLFSALESHQRDAWVDLENIPYSAAWWGEITQGIEGANAIIFVISHTSLTSQICNLEIQHARKRGKHIIPIVRQDPLVNRKLDPNILSERTLHQHQHRHQRPETPERQQRS